MRINSVLFILFFSYLSASAQQASQLYFYQGDTLQGFDMNNCLAEAMKTKISASDMKGFMKKKQMAFVRSKYHLPVLKQRSVLPVITATCNNLNFEAGNTSGWTGATGENDNSQLALATPTVGLPTLGNNSAETSCSYFTLVNTGVDPWGGFPMLDSGGGNWACRLGGESANADILCTQTTSASSPGEMIQQTFLITPSNAMLTYNYAVVLEQTASGHLVTDCPYFRAEVLDAAGNPIPCMQYYVESVNSGIPPGMKASKNLLTGDTVYYSAWRSNSMNLKAYMGQNVTIRFTSAGCTLGAHMGYAYVDASCSPIEVVTSSAKACLGTTFTLTAPPTDPGGSYAWSTLPSGSAGIVGSKTGQIVTLNASGKYEVKITNGKGCSFTIDTTITFYQSPFVKATSTNATCTPGNDGTATALASGYLTGGYTILWSPAPGIGQGTLAATAMSPGKYDVLITNSLGCTHDTTVLVNSPGPFVKATTTKSSCLPGKDGTATATVSGVIAGGYTIVWAPAPGAGQGTVHATGLSAGTYTVTATNVAGCKYDTIVTIVPDPNPVVTATTVSASCLVAKDGAATATVTGVTGTNTYLWSPAPGAGQGTVSATGLGAGTYTLVVTSAFGCKGNTTFVIGSKPNPTVTATSTNASCLLVKDGKATATVAGVTGTYTTVWTPAPGAGQGTLSATGLGAGTYSVTITSAAGCKGSSTVVVSSNPNPSVAATATKSSCPTATDGTAAATVTGVVGTYTTVWAPAPGAGQGTLNATGLSAGTYSVTITTAAGCKGSSPVVIAANPGPFVKATSTNASCFPGGNGTATATVSGVTTYTVLWSPSPAAGQGTLHASGLTAGTYSVTISSAGGCKDDTAVVISNGLISPVITAATSVSGNTAQVTLSEPVLCSSINPDGSNFFIATGPASMSVSAASGIGCSASQTTTSQILLTLNGSASGNYTIGTQRGSDGQMITDACSNKLDSTITTFDYTFTPECQLKLYSGFSPNQDQHNDSWIIDCIESEPVNHVTILNKWGQIVWQVANYDNVVNVWKGTNQEGQALPDGTYFYELKLSWKTFKGRVEIVR